MKCPACKSKASLLFIKDKETYNLCKSCGTISVKGGLPQKDMVGGTGDRSHQDIIRASRFEYLYQRRVLDYGCGNGNLVDVCNSQGLDTDGYDQYNKKYDYIKDIKYDLVSMVEVIEHLSAPFNDLDIIYSLLNNNGFVYIETTFIDNINHPYINSDYVNPKIGHCTIFSYSGLNILMERKGFTLHEMLNENTIIYKK